MPETPPSGGYGPPPAPAAWFSRFGQYSISAHSTPEHGRPVPNDPFDSRVPSGYLSPNDNPCLGSAEPPDQVITPTTTSPTNQELLHQGGLGFGRSPSLASSSTVPIHSTPDPVRGVRQSSYNASTRSGYHAHGETSYQACQTRVRTEPQVRVPLQLALPDDPFVTHPASASQSTVPLFSAPRHVQQRMNIPSASYSLPRPRGPRLPIPTQFRNAPGPQDAGEGFIGVNGGASRHTRTHMLLPADTTQHDYQNSNVGSDRVLFPAFPLQPPTPQHAPVGQNISHEFPSSATPFLSSTRQQASLKQNTSSNRGTSYLSNGLLQSTHHHPRLNHNISRNGETPRVKHISSSTPRHVSLTQNTSNNAATPRANNRFSPSTPQHARLNQNNSSSNGAPSRTNILPTSSSQNHFVKPYMSGAKPFPNSVIGGASAKKELSPDLTENYLHNIECMTPWLEGFLREFGQTDPAVSNPVASAVRLGSQQNSNSGVGSNDHGSSDRHSGDEATDGKASDDEGTPLANRLPIPSSEDDVFGPYRSGAKHYSLAVPGAVYHVESVKGNEYMSGTKPLSPANFTPSHRSFPSLASPGSSTGVTETSQARTTRDSSRQTPHRSNSRAMSSDETTSPMSAINTAGPSQTGTARDPATPTAHRGVSSGMLSDSNPSPASIPPPTTPQRGRADSGRGTVNTTPSPGSIFRGMLSGAIPSPAPAPLPTPTPPTPPSARLTETQRAFIATLAWQGRTAGVIHHAYNTQFPTDLRTLRCIQGERTRARNRTGLYRNVQPLPGMEDDGEQAQRAKRMMDARDRHR